MSITKPKATTNATYLPYTVYLKDMFFNSELWREEEFDEGFCREPDCDDSDCEHEKILRSFSRNGIRCAPIRVITDNGDHWLMPGYEESDPKDDYLLEDDVWLKIELSEPLIARKIRWTNEQQHGNIKEYILQGSNDDCDWVDLMNYDCLRTETEEDIVPIFECKLNNNEEYLYYRFIINDEHVENDETKLHAPLDKLFIFCSAEGGVKEISTAQQLNAVRDNVGGDYRLTADIDLSGIAWTPIQGFSGNFDGNGYIIKNLSLNLPSQDYAGLFGINFGTIQNVCLENTSITGRSYIATLVGANYGVINNSAVKNVTASGTGFVGGLIGQNNGFISNCLADGVGIIKGTSNYIGGFVGYNNASVIESYSTLDVQGGSHAGGFAGSMFDGLIEQSYATGSVNADSGSCGGFIGCVNYSGVIKNCYSLGNTPSVDNSAGFIGNMSSTATVEKCYAVTNNSNGFSFDGTELNSYFNNDFSSSTKANGRTTTEMMNPQTYENWDFNETWALNNSFGYPFPVLRCFAFYSLESVKSHYFGINGTHSPTGNYSQTFTDMTVPTVLGDITFSRTYNSLNYETSVVGKSFSFSYDVKIITEGNNKNVILPNGSRWAFEENNDTFTALDSRGILTKQGSDYILETLDQMRYVFNSSGFIKYIEDLKGNRVTITTDTDGRITSLTDPAGASVTFMYNGNYLTSITDNKSTRNASYTYNGSLLTSVIDAGGFTTTYSYTDDFLSGIDDNSGRRVLTLTYMNDEYNGKIHTITDVTGNVKTYTYDRINKQTTITDSNGRTTIEGYDSKFAVTVGVNELGYTSSVNYLLTDGVNKFNEIRSATDIYGNITSYERDSRGNIIRISYPDSSTESFTFDSLNNKTSYTDRNNAVTWYIYDGCNLEKEVRPLDGVSEYSETANPDDYAITAYTYYPNGTKNGLIKTVTAPLGDADNYIHYEYNSIGEISKTDRYIDGIPYSTQYVYDGVHRITQETAPDGTITDYVYNQAGQVLETTIIGDGIISVFEIVYDNLGRKTKEISPIDGESVFIYNNAGFVQTQTDALNHSTHFEYDFYGNIIKQTLLNSSYSLYTYDALNRKTSEKFHDNVTGVLTTLETASYSHIGTDSIVTSVMHIDTGLTATTIERCDFEGNLLEKTAPNGAIYTYMYENGRLMSENHNNFSTIDYVYDAWGNVIQQTSSFDSTGDAETLYIYDKAGNMTSQRVKNNHAGEADSYARTDFEYDAWGRKTATVYFDNEQENSRVTVVYDWADRVLEQHKKQAGLASPANSVVSFEYDHMGNIIEKTDALGQVEVFVYDVAGRLVSTIDRNDAIHTITYDLMNNPLTKTSVNGVETLTKTYTYNSLGNLLTVNDGTDLIIYTYNGRGNRLSETCVKAGGFGGIEAKTFTYNNAGSLKSSKIELSGVVQQNVSYAYNNMNQVAEVYENSVLIAIYSYDELGRKSTVQKTNNTTETTNYNSAGLVTAVKNTNGNSTISEYDYTYYFDGNQRTKTEVAGVTTYTYDGLNRLKTATLHDGTVQEYEFDANGNRTKLTITNDTEISETTYTYDANDRLTSQTENGIITDYTYDNNGNMLTKTGVVQTFDLLNRMTSWTDGTKTALYTYNPDNMRRSKTVDNVTTEHVWLGTDIALDKTGNNVVSYVGSIKSDYGWYVRNAHGDVVQLTDGAGVVTTNYDYDPYGNQLIDNSSCLNPYRYNRQYFDIETGYVYLRARYLNTSTGRFIGIDPIMDGLNWYVYAANNPLMFIDPSGLIIKLCSSNSDDENDRIMKELNKLTNHTLKLRDDGTVYIGTRVTRRRDLTLKNGNALVERMISSSHTATIEFTSTRGNSCRYMGYSTQGYLQANGNGTGVSSTVFFNPSVGADVPVTVPTRYSNFTEMRETPLHIILGHELIHADRFMRGRSLVNLKFGKEVSHTYRLTTGMFSTTKVTQTVLMDELVAIGIKTHGPRRGDITENMLRREHNLWERVGY